MGTRYADENIGEITDDEVIFKSGEKYLLKEIRKAGWLRNDDDDCDCDFSDYRVWLVILLFLVLVSGGIALFVYNLLAGFLYVPIAIWLFVKTCNAIDEHDKITGKIKIKIIGKITLYAKNGERMFSYEIGTDGERFVEQLNRYIG